MINLIMNLFYDYINSYRKRTLKIYFTCNTGKNYRYILKQMFEKFNVFWNDFQGGVLCVLCSKQEYSIRHIYLICIIF